MVTETQPLQSLVSEFFSATIRTFSLFLSLSLPSDAVLV